MSTFRAPEPGQLARVVRRERVGVAAVRQDVELLRVGEVGDVEQPRLRAPAAAAPGGALADPEEPVRAQRVEVRREARDLELAQELRVVGVGEVDRVERVRLHEGDDDRQPVEPNPVSALTLSISRLPLNYTACI